MDPVTAAALASAAASLGGSFLQNKAGEKAAEQSAAQRAQEIDLIKAYGARAQESILPAYQGAQDVRQQNLQQSLALSGQSLQPMIGARQSGDYMAQQAILAGLMGQRDAIMGNPINYGALAPQNVPVDYSAISGLTQPQGIDFKQFQTPEFSTTGQMDWNAQTTQDYLRANPDVAADYQANREALLAGGDPQFRTLEGFAKWHYDNYGRAEGRPLKVNGQDQASGQSNAANVFSGIQSINFGGQNYRAGEQP
jgi:hypothetical protein